MKVILCIAAAILGVLACLVLILCKKTHALNFIAVAVATALLITCALLIDIRLPEDYYNGDEQTKQNAIGSVTLTIRCDAIPDLEEIEHLPNDGMIVATETYEIEQGETVYDILIEAARKHGLHVDTEGSGEAAYVRGLEHLYNGDYGDVSGWAYYVNNTSPMVGCGAYTLSDGDSILWEYSLNLWGE
ncbi:MAG: DUF4430 domain-containing protein [Clostridia bacterium]|nr:DUF4430 domain-containing protein [Clostridia bacterium]